MERYSIADLITEIDCRYPLLKERIAAYKVACDKTEQADIVIDISEEMYQNMSVNNPGFNRGECEYMLAGDMFYRRLLKFDGMLLHASAVEKDGEAYLFSAKSGTGKSTHTHLWLDYFKDARIINDDKPAIRLIDGKYYAYGTPFSGKTDESVNVGVQIKAIVFIERSETNKIRKINPDEAIPLMMNQTIRPSGSPENMDILLDFMDGLLTTVPIYKLSCDISSDAVKTAYEGINGEKI